MVFPMSSLWVVLGQLGVPLEPLWGLWVVTLARLGVPLGALGGCGGSLWAALGCLWEVLGHSGDILGCYPILGTIFRVNVAKPLCLCTKYGLATRFWEPCSE